MKIRNLIIVVLCFSAASGRAEDKLIRVVNKDKVSNLTEIYYVRKQENSIKQGEYTLVGPDKKVYIQGTYFNSQRTGVWTFCRYSGELSRKFDFDKDSVVEYKLNEEDSTAVMVRSIDGWQKKEVSSPPFPLYGDLNFIIGHNLTYPAKDKHDGVQGTVVVAILIDKSGVVVASGIKKGVDELLDQEALRLISQIPVWYPAVDNGKKMSCEFLIPVRFVLKK